jgi:predicted GTPase
MDAAHEHLNVHNEISEALAGRTMGGVVDEDDEAAEMAQFLEGYAGEDVASVQANPTVVVQDRRREEDDLSKYEADVLRTLSTLSATGQGKVPAAAVSRSGK